MLREWQQRNLENWLFSVSIIKPSTTWPFNYYDNGPNGLSNASIIVVNLVFFLS